MCFVTYLAYWGGKKKHCVMHIRKCKRNITGEELKLMTCICVLVFLISSSCNRENFVHTVMTNALESSSAPLADERLRLLRRGFGTWLRSAGALFARCSDATQRNVQKRACGRKNEWWERNNEWHFLVCFAHMLSLCRWGWLLLLTSWEVIYSSRRMEQHFLG